MTNRFSPTSTRSILQSLAPAAPRLALKAALLLGSVFGFILCSTASALHAQEEVSAIVTAMPKSGEAPAIPQSQIQVSVDGKQTPPSLWRPYRNGPVELVLLIDSSLRTSMGRNLEDISQFLSGLPPNVTVGVAYMQNGAAVFSSPMTADHAAAAKLLHLPGGSPGSSASPYFCLSDLAKRWPAPRSEARREVLMITDGVDPYNLRYDPEDPYLHAAVSDTQRAGMVVYSIYYRDQGRLSGSYYETNAGQNYLTQVADETGGRLFYEGSSNPVSFKPFFDDLTRRIGNQYELSFSPKQGKKDSFVSLKVKSAVSGIKIDAPQHVAVPGAGK